jgi:hypothetical protein
MPVLLTLSQCPVPASERTANGTARRSLRSPCVPESSEHPRNAANPAPASLSVFAGFRPYSLMLVGH